MDLEKRLKTVVQNKLEYSLEIAIKRGYTITNQEFLTLTACCPFGAVYVVNNNLWPNKPPCPEVNVFTIVKLLDLPLEVVDAFLDGFDFDKVPVIEPGFPRYRRNKNADACYTALNMGGRFKREWLRRPSKKKK